MTAHDPAFHWPEPPPPPHVVAGGSLVRPLAWLAALSIATATTCFVLLRPRSLPWPLPLALPPGSPGVITGSLLLAGLGLVACLDTAIARRRHFAAVHGAPGLTQERRTGYWRQTIVTLLLAALATGAIILDWPRHTPASVLTAPSFAMASALLLLATPWLLAERFIVALTKQRLPEMDDLRALVFLPVFCLAAEAALQVAETLGFGFLYWPRVILAALLLLIGAEVTLRTLAARFLPPPDGATARASIHSLLAALLRGSALTPTAVAEVVRTQFGMDFSRSWALRFMRAAFIPVTLLLLTFCWFLTGVTRIDLNQRGSYERFGVPVSMLSSGLHLVLPWPFGTVRHLELGVIHSAQIRFDDHGDAPDRGDTSTAEGAAPATANRLWDAEQPTDVSYIIASDEQNRQSFQTVSVSARVLFRIGTDDGAGRAALYREADADGLVHALASRMLAQFFAAQTLPGVIGENQAVIAGDVRGRLQRALDQLGSGIDILAVVIEAIHPPSGAASAYRNVQAAEIEATASIASERGRAQTTQGVARMKARGATDEAAAAAAETVSAARVELTDITADDRPYHLASRPFLLRRYFSDLQAALDNVPLEIVDHRLEGASLPTIDLRPPAIARDGGEPRAQPSTERSAASKGEKMP